MAVTYAEAPTQSPANPVDALLAAEFSETALWRENRDVPETIRRIDQRGYEQAMPAIAAVYGARVVNSQERTFGQRVQVEMASLGTMIKIQKRLSETVLAGEHIHTSVLVDPPEPALAEKSVANNTVWLETIDDEHWGVMYSGEVGLGDHKIYIKHDYADDHTVNMSLMPGELQGLMSTAAKYELAWRKGYLQGKHGQIYHGNDSNSPAVNSYHGLTETSGTAKLDTLSNTPAYVELLGYMMEGESGESQLAKLTTIMESGVINDLTNSVRILQSQTADLLNFTTLHATGRSTTPEAIQSAVQAVLKGTARVANKLNGRPIEGTGAIEVLTPPPTEEGAYQAVTPKSSRRIRFLGALATWLNRH